MTTDLAPETWDRGVELEFADEDDRGRVRQAECGAVRLPVLLHGSPGPLRSTPCPARHRRPGDLDDHEVRPAMKAQRHLKEPDLSGLDPVWAEGPDNDPGCGAPMAGRSAAVVRLGGPVAVREAQACR
jgi:hypothetical protein